MKAYVANGLFSQADRDFNDKLVRVLREKFPTTNFYLPQENMGINDKSKLVTSIDIAKADMEKLRESDFLIAVLDGVEIDSGTAAEVGAAYALGIPVFGLCTDIRYKQIGIGGEGIEMANKCNQIFRDVTENSFLYRNLFVTGLIKLSGGGMSKDEDELVMSIRSRMEIDERNR